MFGTLVFLIDPPYNLISTLVHDKNPSDSEMLALLWTFMVLALASLVCSSVKSFNRSYVRRSHAALFSVENANIIFGIATLVVAVVGIIVEAVK